MPDNPVTTLELVEEAIYYGSETKLGLYTTLQVEPESELNATKNWLILVLLGQVKETDV